MHTESKRTLILALIADGVADLLYYDRKEDDVLPRGAIEDAIAAGEITIEDMVAAFEQELRTGIR